MGNIIAIAKKELRIYFTTATSYALICAFTVLSAYFFLQLVHFFQLQSSQFQQMRATQMMERLNFNDSVITPLFSNIQVFFLFLLPMITMRLIAEEKRTKTMQLLMTSPVRPLEIVLGKYLAAAAVTACMLAVTLAFPLLLNHYSDASSSLDWATVWTGYLGMFLTGAVFLAIGLFCSSVTESQVVAVALSFAALLMFWVIGWAGVGKEGFFHEFTTYLSLLNHLEGFSKGLIRVQDLVYFGTFIVLGLFLTQRMVEAERWR